MEKELILAIEDLERSISAQNDERVLMPPQCWSKYRRMLRIAGIEDGSTMTLDQLDVDTEDRSFYDEC